MESQTATPFSQPITATPQGSSNGGFKKLLPKIVILLVILGAVVGGFMLFRNISQKQNAAEAVGQIQPLSGAELVVLTDQTQYSVGEIVPVTVKVFTGGYTTIGTDLILKYDSSRLELVNAGDILSGDAYPEYPLKNFDPATGTVAVSGISALNSSGFNGIGTLTTINFRAKSAGVAKVTVDFTPKATADSNVIKGGVGAEASEDILAKVTNLDINIK